MQARRQARRRVHGAAGAGAAAGGAAGPGAATLALTMKARLYLLCYTYRAFPCHTYGAVLTMAVGARDAGAAAGDQGRAGQEPRHARRAAAQHALLTCCDPYCGTVGCSAACCADRAS